MLTADVRFEGFTAEDWSRFLHLWKPRAAPDREATRPRGGVLVVHDGMRIRKMLHTRTGRLEIPTERWPVPLATLGERYHASWGLAAHAGALDEVMERFGARAQRTDDLTRQSLTLVHIVREMIAEGALDHWPRRLRGFPPPTEGMVRASLDALCPDGQAVALGTFKEGALWTAFVARRKGAKFDLIAGPDDLRPAMGLLSGDFRRDYAYLVEAVEARYAKVALGCFAEVDTLRALQTDATPGAWGRAVLVRDVVLSPVPLTLGLALGVDGARYAFEQARSLASRFDPLGLFDPLARGLQKAGERFRGVPANSDVPRVLGFDPMAALRALLKR